jgi:hypothetical protein
MSFVNFILPEFRIYIDCKHGLFVKTVGGTQIFGFENLSLVNNNNKLMNKQNLIFIVCRVFLLVFFSFAFHQK